MPKSVGQPTKYKPEYCATAVEYLGKGHSIVALAGKLGVAESTAHEWAKKHPEFREALDLGISRAVGFWEERLIAVADGTSKAHPTAIIFGLKNRAGSAWRDVQSLEHTGKDGKAIEVANHTTADRARALAAFIAKTKIKEKE